MKEIEMKIPHDSSHVSRVTSVPDEAGMKFYLTTSEKFDLLVTRLDIFSTSAEDSPSDERKFGYEVNKEERSILFTLDIPQALGLLEAYGVIDQDLKWELLAKTGFMKDIEVERVEQAFEQSKICLASAQKKPEKMTWGCRDNMYKAGEDKNNCDGTTKLAGKLFKL